MYVLLTPAGDFREKFFNDSAMLELSQKALKELEFVTEGVNVWCGCECGHQFPDLTSVINSHSVEPGGVCMLHQDMGPPPAKQLRVTTPLMTELTSMLYVCYCMLVGMCMYSASCNVRL